MDNFTLIIVSLVIGLLLKRVKSLPENTPEILNQFVIYVSLPALILYQMPKLQLSSEALIPPLASWLLLLIAAGTTWLVCRLLNWSKQITACLMLVVPLGNTSFVGLPLLESLIGEPALVYGILYDQLGSFIALSSYGLLICALYSGDTVTLKSTTKRIITFPPFISLIFAIVVAPFLAPYGVLDHAQTTLKRLADTLVPVVLVAVGLQWQLKLEREKLKPIAFGLTFKLLAMPAIAWLVLSQWQGKQLDVMAQVIVLEAGMAPMITAGALAASHGYAPKMAASMVAYGLLLCLALVPAWYFVIS